MLDGSGPPPAASPSNKDEEHLRLLATGHLVLAGLTALFACMPLIHLTVGIVMLVAPESMSDNQSKPPPAFVGILFAVVGGAFVLVGWTLAALILAAGRAI